MRNIRALIARILVACMLFNLMVPAISVYAETQTTTKTSETTATGDNKSQVKDAQAKTESGKASLDQNAKDKAAQQGKTLSTSTGTDVNTAINQAAKDQEDLDSKGKTMEQIGNIMKIAGAVLGALGAVLSAIPVTAAVGAAMVAAGTALVTIGTLLETQGKKDQSGANKASTADKNLVNDSSKASTTTTTTTTTTTVDSKAVFTDTNAGSAQTTTGTTAQRGTTAPAGAE